MTRTFSAAPYYAKWLMRATGLAAGCGSALVCEAALAADPPAAIAPNSPAAPAAPTPPPPPPSTIGTSDHTDHVKPSVVVWPTLMPAGDAPGATPLHKPTLAEGRIFERAQELDATLRDAVEDLGYTLYVADTGPVAGHTRDEDLLERAGRSALGQRADEARPGTWVVSPRLESAGGGDYVVRLVAVAPSSHELRVRVETVAGDLVAVRGLVMLRDLLTPGAAATAASEAALDEASRTAAHAPQGPSRSQGRAVLAVSTGLFGAFTAFSLQQASNSTDPRVLYPLLAVGTGIGIGSALLAADEWDVTSGDAWVIAAGGLWGAASGFLIAAGRDVEPTNDRYSWGVSGGLVGLSLATLAVTQSTMDDGDATLVHSGSALGLAFGAATQYLYEGSTGSTPYTGMGYGAAIGLVGAGVLSTRVNVSPSRVLLIDLGAGGGALLGAAAGSPLVFNNQTESNTRWWLGATVGGALLGGGLAYWLTRDVTPAPHALLRWGTPSAGVIATTPTRTGTTPVYGISWSGPF
jgi:hypothetical protein